MRRTKKIFLVSSVVLLLCLIVFISRGPNISNALKKIILPELKAMTGRSVIAQKIYINIFPLFVEAKGLKVFDDEGKKVMTARRVKAYISLTGLFKRELTIKRLVLSEPEIWTNRAELEDIGRYVKAYMAQEKRPLVNIKVKAAEVKGGEFLFYEDSAAPLVKCSALSGELQLSAVSRLSLNIKDITANIKDIPEFKGSLKTVLLFKKNAVEIDRLNIDSSGSDIRGTGSYSPGGFSLAAEASLAMESFKKLFGLKNRGEGWVSVKGAVKDSGDIPGKMAWDWKTPFLDLKIEGNFYIQTLMELLKVEEKVEGLTDFSGRLEGRFPEIKGTLEARLRNGNLFDVDVDDLKCKVLYSDGIFSFKDGSARLYDGHADAEASLRVRGESHYSLRVGFTDIDSPAIFKLIGWEPGFSKGKVKGDLYTEGEEFNPKGGFEYELRAQGTGYGTNDNALRRVKKIKGQYDLSGNILKLKNTVLATDKTTLNIDGMVNIETTTLSLRGDLRTEDIKDLTLPDFKRISSRGEISGSLTGTYDDPLIEGTVKLSDTFIDNYPVGDVKGEVLYRKQLFTTKGITAHYGDEQHSLRGNIKFTGAKKIFDFKGPVFGLSATLKNARSPELTGIFYKPAEGGLPVRGRLNSDFTIKGSGPQPEYSGTAVLTGGQLFNAGFSSLSFNFSYDYKAFLVRQAVFKRGSSSITGEAGISHDDSFYFKASSDRFLLADAGLRGVPADLFLAVEASGRGFIKNPEISLKGIQGSGNFRGRSIGGGSLNASLKDRDILWDASFFDGKVMLKGRAYLDDNLPWNAELEFRAGRYDFLAGLFLKEVPDDLLFNMKGNAVLSGTREHLRASATIRNVNLTVFGYSFSNDSDIKLEAVDRSLMVSALKMRGGDTAFNVKGDIDIGTQYNIIVEGSSALSPFKALSRKISVLSGKADFVLALTGKWDRPKINGGLTIENAVLGLKDIYQRLSSANAYMYVDEDKVYIQNLSGKIGGGDVQASGLVYLNGVGVKRFYLDAQMQNVTTSFPEGPTLNFGGNLLYKGTPAARSISGMLRVNRAKYKQRVEWKSWLLKAGAKELPKTEGSGTDKTELNIGIYGDENIDIDNNIVRTSLKVDTILRGTLTRPVLIGRVESKGGNIYFRNNEFRIISAVADFSDTQKMNPVMGIFAETAVKGYNIKLGLEGQFEHFNLSLASDPPLEEIDILSLLTVGQFGRQLKGIEGGIGASEATAFLTGKMQDVFEERLSNITGLDRFQVAPYVSKKTSTITPRVTVVKRLMEDKLNVTYTSSVGSAEEQVLKLEYLLGRNTSLVGVRDERGSIGGDIKFRFEFK